jgi:hypothetical protein
MKKIILGLILGFLLNSSLRTYYNYLWWSTERKITNEELNKSIEIYGYPKIINEKIGIQDNIKYILIYPSYDFGKWGIQLL